MFANWKRSLNSPTRGYIPLAAIYIPHGGARLTNEKYEHCFVKSFGWYENLGTLNIAMEFFPLGDLHRCLQETPGHRLQEEDAQMIVSQIIEGVNFMHTNRFAHRDLKPSVRLSYCIADPKLTQETRTFS